MAALSPNLTLDRNDLSSQENYSLDRRGNQPAAESDFKRMSNSSCRFRWKFLGMDLVELSGIEPLASSLRTRRSPS
jgi:hypothetical protein